MTKTEKKSKESMNLNDLVIEQVNELYSAEKQLLKAIPAFEKNISSSELKEVVKNHVEETREQVKRLDEVFSILKTKYDNRKCMAMEALINEAVMIRDEVADPQVRDAVIIAGLQKIEHYEIASYGTIRTFCQVLGLDDVADLLQETLDEEEDADAKLTEVAEATINPEAVEVTAGPSKRK